MAEPEEWSARLDKIAAMTGPIFTSESHHNHRARGSLYVSLLRAIQVLDPSFRLEEESVSDRTLIALESRLLFHYSQQQPRLAHKRYQNFVQQVYQWDYYLSFEPGYEAQRTGFEREVMGATDENEAWRLITKEDTEERQLIMQEAATMTTILIGVSGETGKAAEDRWTRRVLDLG